MEAQAEIHTTPMTLNDELRTTDGPGTTSGGTSFNGDREQ